MVSKHFAENKNGAFQRRHRFKEQEECVRPLVNRGDADAFTTQRPKWFGRKVLSTGK
jgi:hypothetical protein